MKKSTKFYIVQVANIVTKAQRDIEYYDSEEIARKMCQQYNRLAEKSEKPVVYQYREETLKRDTHSVYALKVV